MSLKIEYMKTADLTPYDKNAKQHPESQIQQIIKSIEAFGMDDPIAVWGDNNLVVEGHGRLLACQRLGMDEVPVIRLDHLTDEQRKAYTLIHNQLTMNSGFDLDLLNGELDSIFSYDMSDFGFDIQESVTDDPVPEDDDFDAALPAEPRSKLGDIYLLGDHVLMCGDSTKPEDVEKLMGGFQANLFITDPPYNVAIGDKNKALEKIQKSGRITENIAGDAENKTDEQTAHDLWIPAFANALHNAADDCSIYVTMPQGGTHMMMMMSAQEAGWQVKHELVWVKNAAVFSMGRLDYDYRHEPILYGWNQKHSFNRVDGDYKTSVLDCTEKIDEMSKAELQALLHKIIDNSSVIYEDKPRKADLHPTMKPVPLFGRLIRNSSRQGDVVLDLFGGSGTTVIACEQLHRKCRVMEFDPRYVDVIIDRWETYTGQKAEKLTD